MSISLFLHLYQLELIPKGIFSDEASIGVNAASIATTLHDEHGEWLPVYFKAFGEYKNPLYIYTAAGFFKLFGISDMVLRSTSVFFFIVFQIGLWLLIQSLGFRKITQYLLLLFSTTLPYVFSLSRISFEVISLLTTSIFLLYFLAKSTTEDSKKSSIVLCGLLLSLTFLSYSTARFLAPLWALGILLIYYKVGWKRIIPFLLGGFPILSLCVYFVYTHPYALTERFSSITYLSSPTLSVLEKLRIFATNYSSYFSLEFLLFSGDPVLRHHTGSVGMLFFSVALLSLFGIGTYLVQYKKESSFWHMVMYTLLLSPVPAALTNEPMHSLRSITLAVGFLLFAGKGVEWILSYSKLRFLPFLLIPLFFLFSFESYNYISDYFTSFATRSITSFETAGLPEALQISLSKANTPLYISSKNPTITTIITWYSFVYPKLTQEHININMLPVPHSPTCHIFPQPTRDNIFVIKCAP